MIDRKSEITPVSRDLSRPLVNTMLAVRPNFREIKQSDLDAIATATIGRPLGLSQQQLDQAVDPVVAVARRGGIGGAAREAVGALIEECRSSLDGHADWQAKTSSRLAASERALLVLAERTAEGR